MVRRSASLRTSWLSWWRASRCSTERSPHAGTVRGRGRRLVRKVARPVIFTSEDPPGGGPAAALVAGVRRALAEPSDVIVTLPADAPLGGQAASTLLSRLESEPSTEAVVGVDAHGREQPLQLALRPPRPRPWWQPLGRWCSRGFGAPAARCTPARIGRPGARAGRALGHRHA